MEGNAQNEIRIGKADRSMNFGIIGYGYAGQQHAAALASIEGVTLCAIAEVDERKRARASAQTYADYRVLLENPSIDAVSICLPHHLHEEVALAALSAGKHILVEKPLALTVAAGGALCNLAKTTNRILMVTFPGQLGPMQAANFYAEVIDDKEIADMLLMVLTFDPSK